MDASCYWLPDPIGQKLWRIGTEKEMLELTRKQANMNHFNNDVVSNFLRGYPINTDRLS